MDKGGGPVDDELLGLFDLSHDAFCIAGFDGYLRRANPAFARSLGYTLDELLARPFMDNVYADDVESVRTVLAALAAGDDIVGFECREVCADGSVRWFEWSTSSRPEAGIVYGVARDVTERRVANDELSALRRIATLAAEGVAPSDLFAVVAEEAARVVNVPLLIVARYEVDDTATECASFPPEDSVFPVGKRWSLHGTNVLALVRTNSGAARIDDYAQLDGQLADAARRVGIRSTVGVPIVVAGRLWGTMVVSTREPDPLPGDTAARLASFTGLLATAIGNAESREALGQLADEQAALRRVATLVARGASPVEVFEAVADEMARCVHVSHATLSRHDAEKLIPVAIYHGDRLQQLPEGLSLPLEGDNVATRIFHTGRTVRMDSHDKAAGTHAARIRELGIRSAVGVPILVDGSVWGAAIVGSSASEPLPPETETHIADFADLVATAVANAATRAELIASRARIVAAADEGRRRLERDLHDGAQQRLVALGLQARLAEASVPAGLQPLGEQLADIAAGLTAVTLDLQEISRGIHPAILSKGGIGPALKMLARHSAVPVTLELAIDRRLPDSLEVGAYYFTSEALTNAAKHSRASRVAVRAQAEDDVLLLSISDDGIGGADFGKGSGLIGLRDRVEALGGRLRMVSPAGRGTSLDATIPIDSP
jgi:PAS domain S-box-containing protein